MAGANRIFVRILLRQARAASEDTATQKAFLENLITGNFNEVKNGDSTLISSTINGKTIQFSPAQGMRQSDVLIAAEVALEWLESGLPGPTSEVYGRSF